MCELFVINCFLRSWNKFALFGDQIDGSLKILYELSDQFM